MFDRVLNTLGIFQKNLYTLWNTSLILSHPPSLLGHCPKFTGFVVDGFPEGLVEIFEVEIADIYDNKFLSCLFGESVTVKPAKTGS